MLGGNRSSYLDQRRAPLCLRQTRLQLSWAQPRPPVIQTARKRPSLPEPFLPVNCILCVKDVACRDEKVKLVRGQRGEGRVGGLVGGRWAGGSVVVALHVRGASQHEHQRVGAQTICHGLSI